MIATQKTINPGLAIKMVSENPVLAAIHDVLLSRAFEPSVTDPVQEGEKVIGQMSDFEKAIFSAAIKAMNEHNQMVAEYEQTGKQPDMDKLVRLEAIAVGAQSLLFPAVIARLGGEICAGEGSLREDYKIVKLSSNIEIQNIGGTRVICAPDDLDLETIIEKAERAQFEEKSDEGKE